MRILRIRVFPPRSRCTQEWSPGNGWQEYTFRRREPIFEVYYGSIYDPFTIELGGWETLLQWAINCGVENIDEFIN
jgi:hypothetical protein